MAHHGGQAVVSCQMCEQSSQIEKKCLDCDYLLCANCCQLHKKVKELSNHQLVELHDIGSIKEGRVDKINFTNIPCRSHADQKCCLFCKDCDQVVCAICISEKHNQHKMIQISEGHKLHTDKIATLRNDLKCKIRTLTTDMATLDTKYATENSKYSTEMEKVLGRDKVLKEAVDTQTKSLVHDLDQRWDKINTSVNNEKSRAEKYKQHLQLREEQLKQAIESTSAGDVFRTVEKEQGNKKADLSELPVNLKYETLPTFNTREINLSMINSLHGSLVDKKVKALVDKKVKADVKNIEICALERYQTDNVSLASIKCNPDGTMWIYHHMEGMLRCVEKSENNTLTTTWKREASNIQHLALTPSGDLLLAVGESYLLKIPHSKQTVTRTQYNVSPLVTTAIHASSNKIIVGARDQGSLYPARGPRQVIVMDIHGKHEKLYQFDANNRPLFTNPRKVTMDSRNNLFILDRRSEGYRGRVVTINNHTGKIIVYKGHPKVNNEDHPLMPGDIVATKSDNVVVSDRENHLLHILNSDGECVKYINTEEHGIKWPWSLEIDNRDLLHIGCFKKGTIQISTGLITGAKLHVVKFTGF